MKTNSLFVNLNFSEAGVLTATRINNSSITMARTRGSAAAANEVHVLDFDLDNDNDCCGLTVLVKGFRFHIMADLKDLLKPTSDGDQIDDDDDDYPIENAAQIGEEFRRLVAALRAEQEEAEYKGGARAQNETNELKQPAELEKEKTSHEETNTATTSDSDSGVDVESPKLQATQKKDNPVPSSNSLTDTEAQDDPDTALRDWMLKPFAKIFEGLEPVPETEGAAGADRQTLQEWYSGPTYFYKLQVGGDGRIAEEQLESPRDLEGRINKMVPRINVPKSLHKLDIAWYDASDIEVVSAGDHCGLHGPTEVRIRRKRFESDEDGDEDEDDGNSDMIYFFKRVDPAQAAPTKRELEVLKDIEDKGLHHKINVPVVKGIVRWYGSGSSRNQIMGFLQTAIEDPTPLTRMLDSDVVEDKRQEWAKQAQKATKVLHDNDIIWGDAKADNFMVDRHGKLWIIDFGGSYTEGWVDPDLEETEEGDDMGVDKIVGALRDPENMTYDPDAGIINNASNVGDAEDGDENNTRGRKRIRDVTTESSDDEGQASKKART